MSTAAKERDPRGIPLFVSIFLLSLAVLLPASFAFGEPGFIDAYYYFHVAANLASGRGFTEDVIWSYLVEPQAITHPSNLYWMPLVPALASPFMALFGPTFRAAQLPLVVFSAVVPAATALVARRCFGGWFKPLAAAALVLFSGYYFVYWTAVDAFGLYALASGASFLATAALLAGPESPRRTMALGIALGLSCALAQLTRADGPLLLVTNLGVLALARRLPGLASGDPRPATGYCVAAYVLTMTPWFIRNYVAVGTPLPGGGLQTIFLRDYNEFFAYGLTLDFPHYLGQDPGELLAGKASAALRNLGVLFGLQYWLVPFAVIGWRAALQDGRRTFFLPPLVYGIVLYLVMTLVFTFPSGRGTMLHSSVALLPWLAIAAVDGIERAVYWTAARRSHWIAVRAFRNFTAIFLAFAVALSVYALIDQARRWSRQVDAYRELAPAVLGDRADAIPMLLNAPGWWYATGRPAIQTPSNGPDAAVVAARRYGATHLVMEPAVPKAWETFGDDRRFGLIHEGNGYQVYRVQ